MLQKFDFTLNQNEHERLFFDSLVGLYLGSDASLVFPHGRIQILLPGQSLKVKTDDQLHILLKGVLLHDLGWLSPGCHFTELDSDLTPKDAPALLWSLDRSAPELSRHPGKNLRAAIESALDASGRALDAATPPDDLPAPETLCNLKHPLIERQAARLLRTTEEATAQAVFKFVQEMPYRFGTWQEYASTTLERGVGMCTTKANLQAALLRACGLEAGFTEIPMEMKVLGNLMPEAWLALMRPVVRHYFGVVKLDGRWHAADSSYTDAAMGIYLEQFAGYDHLLPAHLATGKPYSPTHDYNGVDVFDIPVTAHLNEEMGKKSRFSPMQFEALNTRLDRAQNCWQKWVAPDHPDLQQAEPAQQDTERRA